VIDEAFRRVEQPHQAGDRELAAGHQQVAAPDLEREFATGRQQPSDHPGVDQLDGELLVRGRHPELLAEILGFEADHVCGFEADDGQGGQAHMLKCPGQRVLRLDRDVGHGGGQVCDHD